ncbi:MAG: hypothetical protein H6895_12625 [Defluviimonas sp.]|uniref:hypothetical protein n=1 Tax=Albidovulum sp. TaxID=1872424 RepID=UPI002A2F3D37|nr:hypothetical protein [Defluviimonas sp.]
MKLDAHTPIRSLDDVLDAHASKAKRNLQSDGKVLLYDRVMLLDDARRAERRRRLVDFWRISEAMAGVVCVAGLGYLFHQVLGLFLR